MFDQQTSDTMDSSVNDGHDTIHASWDSIRVYSRFRPFSSAENELRNQLVNMGVDDPALFTIQCVRFNSQEQVEVRVPEVPLPIESATEDWGDPSIVAQLTAYVGVTPSAGVVSTSLNTVLCTSHLFTFSKSFQLDSVQEDVYEEVGAPMVDNLMRGYNGTIFVYGQTGSGKTYTMMGGLNHNHHNGAVIKTNRRSEKEVPRRISGLSRAHSQNNCQPWETAHTFPPNVNYLQTLPHSLEMIDEKCGIIPRSVRQIFDSIYKAPNSTFFSVSMYFVEIYMERVKDLLVTDPSQSNLSVRENPKSGNFFVEGCLQPEVAKPDDIFSLLDYGLTNRTTAITKMNAISSRSHCILCLTLRSVNCGEQKTGKLFFVDLAGSEKVGKIKATGQQLEEAKIINKSLTTLGLVISGLSDRHNAHIPYRNSKLTMILQNSLGGNSRTTLVVCCSPSIQNASETLSTLRFGQRAKSVKNKAVVNREYTIDGLRALLEAAKNEIVSLKRNKNLPSPIEGVVDLNDEKRDKLSQASHEIANNRIRELEQAFQEKCIKNTRHSEENIELVSKISRLCDELRNVHELCEVLHADNYRLQNNVVKPLQSEVSRWMDEYHCLREELCHTKKTTDILWEDLQTEKKISESLIRFLETHQYALNNIKARVTSVFEMMNSTSHEFSVSDTLPANISYNDAVTQLTNEENGRIELETSVKDLTNENRRLTLELQLLTKKLSISTQRIDNLKKGISDEQEACQLLKEEMKREKEELRSMILDARRDSEYWRLEYNRLLKSKETVDSTQDESLCTLKSLSKNPEIGEESHNRVHDTDSFLSVTNGSVSQQILLDRVNQNGSSESVAVRGTNVSLDCIPRTLLGVVHTFTVEDKENYQWCNGAHSQ